MISIEIRRDQTFFSILNIGYFYYCSFTNYYLQYGSSQYTVAHHADGRSVTGSDPSIRAKNCRTICTTSHKAENRTLKVRVAESIFYWLKREPIL